MWAEVFKRWMSLFTWWLPRSQDQQAQPSPEQARSDRAAPEQEPATQTGAPEARPQEPQPQQRPAGVSGAAAKEAPRAEEAPARAEPSGGAAEAVAAPAKPKPEAKAPEKERTPDDLTAIKGIGPAMQKKLNSFGIITFDDLARADGDDLLAKIKETQQVISKQRVEDWIEAARERSGAR